MKKLKTVVIIILATILIVMITAVIIFRENSIQKTLNKYDVSYNEVILTHKVDDKLIFVYQTTNEQGIDLFGALTFSKTKIGFRERSYFLTDMDADITFVTIFFNDDGSQEEVLYLGEILDPNIKRIELLNEDNTVFKPEIIEINQHRIYIFKGKAGRYSFLKYDIDDKVIE